MDLWIIQKGSFWYTKKYNLDDINIGPPKLVDLKPKFSTPNWLHPKTISPQLISPQSDFIQKIISLNMNSPIPPQTQPILISPRMISLKMNSPHTDSTLNGFQPILVQHPTDFTPNDCNQTDFTPKSIWRTIDFTSTWPQPDFRSIKWFWWQMVESCYQHTFRP